MAHLTVLFRKEEESWNAFVRRILESEKDVLVVLSESDSDGLRGEERTRFVAACASVKKRLRLATRDRQIVAAARAEGIRVLDRISLLRTAVAGHENASEATRLFVPNLWRQQLRSQLQTMGLLSVPRLRIWFLILLSSSLFFFVFLRLLPSADIQVWPRRDTNSETANIMLALSGATNLPSHVRTMPLVPIKVVVRRSITFDQISKEFIGKSAELPITLVNKSREMYSLRKGTRVSNQAGTIVRIQRDASIEPGTEVTVRAKAADEDLYGNIIGERGNVPAGLRWDFPGLLPEERKLVYGENRVAGTGGTTVYRAVLKQKDIDTASTLLQKQLTTEAKQQVEVERSARNLTSGSANFELLNYEQLTRKYFHDFIAPTSLLGQAVPSIHVQGSLDYKAFTYDTNAILARLRKELLSHGEPGKRLLIETLSPNHLVVHVIDYADDFSWIKLTVDLTGTEEFVLDPLTPTGAAFGTKVRQAVAGQPFATAARILKNMPEVERVQISLWPPWSRTLPSIPSHIFIRPQAAPTQGQ